MKKLFVTGLLTAGLLFAGGAVLRAGAEEARGTDAAPASEERPLPEQQIGDSWKKAAGEAADRGYSWLAMENERLAFYVNEGGNIGVYDKAGRVWFTSIPTEEEREADETAKAPGQ